MTASSGDPCEFCHKPLHKNICSEHITYLAENAQPEPGRFRNVMLMGLTTRPDVNLSGVTLMWMQRAPAEWAGLHPERCTEVAEALDMEVT